MDEVQTRAVAESIQVRRGPGGREVFLQGDERIEAEHGVVEIARARAILKAAVRVETPAQERRDEIARLTQLLGRQPGDLQHLEPQTHCTSP